MRFELFHAPIVPASTAGLTTQELRRYLGVGKNNVALIARRFGIENLHGIYPECIVWRQLFGLAPDDEAAQAALREPLADINWLSTATGVPQSTIRDHLRARRWSYDRGVQLGDRNGTQARRLRRWIPALIRHRTCGSPLPSFTRIAPHPLNWGSADTHSPSWTTHPPFPAEGTGEEPSEDVFSALFSDAATAPR